MTNSSIKALLKTTVRTGTMAFTPLLMRGNHATRILTYHSVGTRDHEMNVTPEDFRAQMQWLSEHCAVITLRDAVDGEPGVAITFDDGYRDNVTEAVPILAEFAFPATVFIVPGRMGEFLEHDAPSEDARLMTWDEVRQLRAQGIEIGGHTLTHARLATLDKAGQSNEIGSCTDLICEHLGEIPAAFAYPYGSMLDYDEHSVEAVKAAGYQFAVSNQYGPVDDAGPPWEVRRIWIDRSDTLASFQQKASGALDGLAIFDSAIGIRLRRIMNRLLGVS